jgi:hypothetical protein
MALSANQTTYYRLWDTNGLQTPLYICPVALFDERKVVPNRSTHDVEDEGQA